MIGAAFEFDSVTVKSDGRPLLENATGSIPDSGVTAIVGPSGSGKSTLLRLCNRLTVPTSGEVRYRGDDIAELDPLALRRSVAMVFQKPTALPGTVADNLRVAAPDISAATIDRSLRDIGLDGMADRNADELSGGEAQRMCLARSLMTQPEFILFDEATSSLDPTTTRAIERLACDYADRGIPCAWVTHDLDQMRRVGRYLMVVVDGQIAQHGETHRVLADPNPATTGYLAGAAE